VLILQGLRERRRASNIGKLVTTAGGLHGGGASFYSSPPTLSIPDRVRSSQDNLWYRGDFSRERGSPPAAMPFFRRARFTNKWVVSDCAVLRPQSRIGPCRTSRKHNAAYEACCRKRQQTSSNETAELYSGYGDLYLRDPPADSYLLKIGFRWSRERLIHSSSACQSIRFRFLVPYLLALITYLK
jgi:hypothetical protein